MRQTLTIGVTTAVAAACCALPTAAKSDGIETAGNVLTIAIPVAGVGYALCQHDTKNW